LYLFDETVKYSDKAILKRACPFWNGQFWNGYILLKWTLEDSRVSFRNRRLGFFDRFRISKSSCFL